MWRRVSRHKLAGRLSPGRVRGPMHIWFLLLVFVTPCFTALRNISCSDVAAPVRLDACTTLFILAYESDLWIFLAKLAGLV